MLEIITTVLTFLGGPVMSFFGGAAFRMIFGELSSWWTKRQDHAQELDMMRLQGQLAKEQHERNLESQKLQAELGVKVIEAQTTAAISTIEAEGWLEGVRATSRRVGVKWVDGWNAVMRPGIATWGVVMLTVQEIAILTGHVYRLDVITTNVACGAIGIFIASRDLQKRGK